MRGSSSPLPRPLVPAPVRCAVDARSDAVSLRGAPAEETHLQSMTTLRAMAQTKPASPTPSYAPAGRFLWDSWIMTDTRTQPPVYRLYHLDAPQTSDPEARHDQARIRHAVSTDLRHWSDVGEALGPGPSGAWDDQAIWTGNTYATADGYRLFYTGRNQRDGQMQRIGLATSLDGVHWTRSETPLLEPDGRWYETREASPVYKAWRDPAVRVDGATGGYVMLFTAKTRDGDPRFKGCIGAARAASLDGPYEAGPPVLAPGRYAQMEVPQIVERDGKVYLFFSCWAADYAPDWAAQVGGAESGLHAYVADQLEGPYVPVNGNGVVTRTKDNLYTVKMIPDPDRPGAYVAMGWHVSDTPGQRALTLSPPIPVRWEGDRISLDTGR